MQKSIRLLGMALFTLLAAAQPVLMRGADPLVLAERGKPAATVVVSPQAGPWEKRAADEMVRCIGLMTGSTAPLAADDAAIQAALAGQGPVLIVGQQALAADATLNAALGKVAKATPVLRSDAIVLRRANNRVYLAGSNDESHYYAVAELLRRMGCRWYLPTEFGECIPEKKSLSVDALDYAYGPPFEVRRYWLSWLGDTTGKDEFQRRNFMNDEIVPSGHALAQYTQTLVPPGKTIFNVPIAEPATAEHVAKQLAPAFENGERITLGLEDGIYESDSPADNLLKAGLRDKYFMVPSLTDAFLTFYNNVAANLQMQYPSSNAKIGFLAYSNITLPPQRKLTSEKSLVAYLAPIDIDPIHGMDDPRSPPQQEYKEMLYRWAEVMQGRLVIYDYDQGMLVWRDIPNPSYETIRQAVKHYRKAGILGVDTESRGAMATTFLNLYVRGQLYWNPDADVDELLAEFYPKFYGPAAKPMAQYWGAINNAWKESIATEHEFFVAPVVYTPELVTQLGSHLAAGEAALQALSAKPDKSRNEQLYLGRMKFTRLGYEVLVNYMAMTQAAASDIDYAAAVAAGERGLAARKQLTEMNGTFTTYEKIGEGGYAWWPGEVQQYRELLEFTNGTKGTLAARLPLEWAFRRDPHDTGLASSWARKTPDLSWWKAADKSDLISAHMNNPNEWEMLRTDLYPQAQGVLSPDYHYYNGICWYQTEVDLTAEQAAGPMHVKFPGLFAESWLYVNGYLVSNRPQREMWWYNDYRFEWDVDLAGHLQAGKNNFVVRVNNPHHMGGMFRRPFLYLAK
ncbi:MAG: DUF4838 domain-containing protein [Pirellulales bacterium]